MKKKKIENTGILLGIFSISAMGCFIFGFMLNQINIAMMGFVFIFLLVSIFVIAMITEKN